MASIIVLDPNQNEIEIKCGVAQCSSPINNTLTLGESPNRILTREQVVTSVNTGSPSPTLAGLSPTTWTYDDDRGVYGGICTAQHADSGWTHSIVPSELPSLAIHYNVDNVTNLFDLCPTTGGTIIYTFKDNPTKRIECATGGGVPQQYKYYQRITIRDTNTIDGKTYSVSTGDQYVPNIDWMVANEYTGQYYGAPECYLLAIPDFYCPDPTIIIDGSVMGSLWRASSWIRGTGELAGKCDYINDSIKFSNYIRTLIGVSGDTPPETKPYQGDTSYGRGGNGGYIWTDTKETVPSAGAGVGGTMLHVYNLSYTQVQDLRAFLWTDTFIDGIKKLVNEPLDCIVGLFMLPVSPTGSQASITLGNIDSGVSALAVTQDYVDVDMGTVSVPYMWGNFLDYMPYTRASLFLPFIGEIQIDVDECMNGTVHIVYRFDVVSGKVLAFVQCANTDLLGVEHSVVHQYSGDCAYNIPVSANQFNQSKAILSSIALAGMAMAGGVAIGAGASAGEVATLNAGQSLISKNAPQAASGIMDVIMGKQQIVSKSGIGANFGYMGGHNCILRLQRPTQSFADQTAQLRGLPSNVYVNVGEMSGFVSFSDIKVDISGATDTELAQISEYLHSGIYV